MLKEAIILAGGFGTRLQSVVSDVPKPMAPVNGKPFLDYLLNYLAHAGIRNIVLSTGYLADKIKNHYTNGSPGGVTILYSHEEQPLGTGGAIAFAMQQCEDKEVLVVNGDSFFDVDIHDLHANHISHFATHSIALRKVENASRYGAIETDEDRVISFKEKNTEVMPGLINGGIYILNREAYLGTVEGKTSFSIEKDFFEKELRHQLIYGFEYDGQFIDIGTPGTLHARSMSLSTLNINSDWTLFLDRDGVINKRIVDDYVKRWEEFEFLEGVLKALELFDKRFGKIVVVTNQQGIGKGVMRVEDLELIHKNMQYEVTYFKGRVDKVYFSPYLSSENHADRKPGIGMAHRAKKDFPEIDFSKAIMVGDSGSDIAFGKAAGMQTVFIGEENKYQADFCYPSLAAFATAL